VSAELAAEIRISPLGYFDVRRSGVNVSVHCLRCNEQIRQPRRAAPLDLIVLDALKHDCPVSPKTETGC
jgi:hypothetical protein